MFMFRHSPLEKKELIEQDDDLERNEQLATCNSQAKALNLQVNKSK